MVARVAFPAALLAMLIAIWLLTVQTPAQTVSLSDLWVRALCRLSGLSYHRAFLIVRKVVHAAEFFPVGLFLSLSVQAWHDRNRLSRRQMAAIALTCLALSLADQLHKAFVPGREFDPLDLCFDAAGYLLAILLSGTK